MKHLNRHQHCKKIAYVTLSRPVQMQCNIGLRALAENKCPQGVIGSQTGDKTTRDVGMI